MRHLTQREVTLIARCSPKAIDYLSQLHVHPLYGDIVDRLSRRASPVYVMDVLSAYSECLKVQKPDVATYRATWRI